MFLQFLVFEIKYRLARVSTYVYFALWFFVTFFSIAANNFGPIGTGKVFLNGPFALSTYYVQLTMFGTFVISALFGTAALRDFQEDTYALLFTKPISKFAYLGGRWAGSVIVSILVFSGLLLGAFTGSLMPWVDGERLMANNLWYYLQPFLSLTVVQILFLGSVFFAVGALTRRLMIVYLQGVVLFGIYLIASIWVLTSQNLDTFWPSVLDPLGMVLFNSTTKYWSVAEKNSQLLGWEGAFLYNRLLWLCAGIVSLAVTWLRFPMSAEALTARGRRRHLVPVQEEAPVQAPVRLRRDSVTQVFNGGTVRAQFRSLTSMRFANIVREVPFWGIVLLMIMIAGINALTPGECIKRVSGP
ncbi:MAG: ABC transporter permease [Bryobacteraceae bacterium]